MRYRVGAPARLRGRGVFVARRIWIMVALLTVGLFVAGVPATYAHYQTVCDGPGCGDLWQLVPEDVRALDVLGLSVAFYATYNVAIEILFALGYWAVAVLVFWKRSDDPVAWFVSLM